MLKKIHLILGLICITVSSFVSVQPALAAQSSTEELYFKNYTVDYYLSRAKDGDSKMHVVEEFDAVFLIPDHNYGIVRLIPDTNQAGDNLTIPNLDFLDLHVWHNGEHVDYEIEKPKSNVAQSEYFVRIADKQHVYGEQHYRLEYNFEHVITQQDGWQELYWDTNGTGWEQKFENVTARLHIDDQKLRDKITGESWCYVGAEGENNQDRCKITRTDYGWEFQTTNLLPRENLTFTVNFEPDTFALASAKKEYWPFILAIAFPIIWIFLAVRAFKNNHASYEDFHYKKSPFTPVQYLPPANYTVAESDFCYQEGQKCRSQVATIIELAVQNKIDLIHVPQKPKEKDTWKIKIKSTDLQEWQKLSLLAFKQGNSSLVIGEEIEIKFANTGERLYLLGRAYLTAVRDSIKARDLAKIKSTSLIVRRILFIAKGMGIYALILIIGIDYLSQLVSIDRYKPYTYASFYGGYTASSIALIFLGLTPFYIFILSFAIKRGSETILTKQGIELNNYLKGLDEYIKMAEKDRLHFLQSVNTVEMNHENIVRLYEKILPYAMIFNHEKTWFKLLGEYYTYVDVSEPDWYIDYENNINSLDNFVEAAAIYVMKIDFQENKEHKPRKHSHETKAEKSEQYRSRETYGTTTSSDSSSSSGSYGQGYSGGGGGGGGGGAC